MKGGEFIGLDPNEQDPINGVGGEGSQMVVPGAKQPFLFDLPTFVKVKGGEYLFVPGLNALKGIIEQEILRRTGSNHHVRPFQRPSGDGRSSSGHH